MSDGVRHVSWRADAPASLVWAEAQDGGDPARAVVDGIRDLVYLHAAPFAEPPKVLARLTMRYAGIAWGREDVALINERWHKTRDYKQWMIAPGHLSTPPCAAIRHRGCARRHARRNCWQARCTNMAA